MDKRPLEGRRILLTRTEEQASESVPLLLSRGAIPLVWSAISVKPLDSQNLVSSAVRDADAYDAILFTSANAVRFFSDALAVQGETLALFKRARCGAIGRRTADALLSIGKGVDFVAEQYVAESLVSAVRTHVTTGGRMLFPRARVAREIIAESLSGAGYVVDVLPVYETLDGDSAERLAALLLQGVDAICFSSASTVHRFAQARGGASLVGTALAAIGPVTAEAMRTHGLAPTVVATPHTMAGLIAALESHFEG